MKALAWTDGSANNQTHTHGGYGVVVQYFDDYDKFVKEVHISGGRYDKQTSARMEIVAILALLKHLNRTNEIEHIIVYSDNQYCVNTISLGWLENWVFKSNFAGKKNADLWRAVHKQLNMFTAA